MISFLNCTHLAPAVSIHINVLLKYSVLAGSSVGLTIPRREVAKFEETIKQFTALQVFIKYSNIYIYILLI